MSSPMTGKGNTMKTCAIPNFDLVQTYDKFYQHETIHYESLSKLASFFGRTMHVHRHDQFYQIHYVHEGHLHLQLGEKEYAVQAPALFFTPPQTPHAFITEPTATGDVLTVEQNIIAQIADHLPVACNDFNRPIFLSLSHLNATSRHWKSQIEQGFQALASEANQADHLGTGTISIHWAAIIFINIFRLAQKEKPVETKQDKHTDLFRQYMQLIDLYYSEHWSLSDYAKQLNVTEIHLNEVCQKIANTSAKKMVFTRISQEAKYLLTYTRLSVKEIAYQLGFHDPAYFTRFFINTTQSSPKQYRTNHYRLAR